MFCFQSEDSEEEEEDDGIVGPLPAKGPIHSNIAEDIERRAWKMKQKLTGKDVSSVVLIMGQMFFVNLYTNIQTGL